MEKFDGISGDSVEFFRQFTLIAAINKYDDEAKRIIISAYLEGPALSFYKNHADSCESFDVLKKKFQEEFPSSEDYVARFYECKQAHQEELLSFYYNLDGLAAKANITSDSIFIQQFLKGCTQKHREKLVTNIYSNKQALKATLVQMKNILGGETTPQPLNLPVKLVGVSPSTTQQPLQTSAGDSADTFHTPRHEYVHPPTTSEPRRMFQTPRTEYVAPQYSTRTPEMHDPPRPYFLRERRPAQQSSRTEPRTSQQSSSADPSVRKPHPNAWRRQN